MTRYQKLQQPKSKEKSPFGWMKLYNIFYSLALIVFVGAIAVTYYYSYTEKIISEKAVSISEKNPFDLTKYNWNKNQTKNLLIVEEASNYVNHPHPKRMGAHLLSESGATTVLDGDKGNGAFKKSYGIMQVKLGTVYYVKNKRPDLIKLYAPEVNVLPKEDILDKLRKDPYFNAKMAALTHIVLIGVCGDENRATVAYNRGVCKADAQGQMYLNKILQHENEI